MMRTSAAKKMQPRVLVHADEACLGNGRDTACPGGAGGLVEALAGGRIVRRDFYLADPNTTNNRMAITSAIRALELVGARGKRPAIRFVSDSEYLVKGMSVWLRAWKRRDWKNVKNAELWQELDELAAGFDIDWHWVRGHAAHPKNEYADYLATRSAKEQSTSDGLVDSGLLEWLAARMEKGKYAGYDPETDLRSS